MQYLLIYQNGNGYHCNCCREEWESHDVSEFENDDALKSHINSYNESYEKGKHNLNSRIIKAYSLSSPEPLYES